MHFVQECTAIVFLVFTIAYVPTVSSVYLRAVFDMSDIRGEIRFTEDTNNNTRISLNLTGINKAFSWKIHKYPVVYRGNRHYTCQESYTGRMFDPVRRSSGMNYTTLCTNGMQNMCAVGDLSGKHGHLNSSTGNLLDSNLPLNGPNSIFGRSVVLYNDSKPWACALIDYDDVITAVTTFRGTKTGITGTVRLRQPRQNVTLDTSVEINLFYSNDATKGTYNWTLEVGDKTLPEDGRPSFEEENYCTMKTTRVISNSVNIPLARHGPSSQRLHFSLNNFHLAGPMSVIGKVLVLKRDDKPMICGSVYEVLPIEAEALFDINGVKGSFHFKQDSELAPTVVTADIKGLGSNANTYHVHVYRVLDIAMQQKRNSRDMCSNSHVAGHWRPYDTNSAAPGNATVDKYEVGDLSGKYGTIGAKDTLSLVRKDYNLPLFGGKSIMFRSMVIHYNNGSRWVCSNIDPKNAEFLFKVQAKFNGPEFDGNLVVQQASFVKSPHAASHITSFFLDLNYMSNPQNVTKNHNWHIHAKDIVNDQQSEMGKRCMSANGHYNPYQVSLKANYSTTCGPKNLLRCELGDTSSKVGKYSIGGGKNRFTESENYFATINTILGRSVVIHAKNKGSPRIGCANMELVSESFVKKELIFKRTTERKFGQELAIALQVNHWRVIHNTEITDYKENCQKTSVLLLDSTKSDLDKKFEDLKKNWPGSLDNFKPASEEECSIALNLRATNLILAIGFLLASQLV